MSLPLSLGRPQLTSNIVYIFTTLWWGLKLIYNVSHCFSGVMKISFSLLIETRVGRPDLDVLYIPRDCLDEHLNHALNGILQIVGQQLLGVRPHGLSEK
jgi:hypothetical protein